MLGFDLVKHRVISYAKNSHGFAFKISNNNLSSSGHGNRLVNLWTNDDFRISSASDTDSYITGPDSASDSVIPVSIIGGGIGGAGGDGGGDDGAGGALGLHTHKQWTCRGTVVNENRVECKKGTSGRGGARAGKKGGGKKEEAPCARSAPVEGGTRVCLKLPSHGACVPGSSCHGVRRGRRRRWWGGRWWRRGRRRRLTCRCIANVNSMANHAPSSLQSSSLRC